MSLEVSEGSERSSERSKVPSMGAPVSRIFSWSNSMTNLSYGGDSEPDVAM